MHALVTGGAGFIGSTLVDRLLADGDSVTVIDDLSTGSASNLDGARGHGGRFDFIEADICGPDLGRVVDSARPDVIFHLAAQPSVSASLAAPRADAEVNILGTISVAEAARRAGVAKLCYAASGGTLYGEVADGRLPADETEPHGPTSPYGISKGVAVDYLAVFGRIFGLASTALALANVYGPRQNPEGEAGVVAIFAAKLVAGQRPTINGDGNQTRDFVFVDDVVDAFVRSSRSPTTGVVNIGTGTETSVNALFALLAEATGRDLRARNGPAREGEVRRSALDPTRARVAIGWTPTTPLPEGLRRVVESVTPRRRSGAGRDPDRAAPGPGAASR